MATKSFVVNGGKRRVMMLVVGACSLAVSTCCFVPEPASAESTVQAIVCRDPATLAINAPVGDSVVVSPSVTVSGSVSQANQIEVKIDGQFNSIVPLDAAATDFTTTLQLMPGTRTITLTAIDACQIANAVSSVVITYQAPTDTVTGSVGGTLPTDVPGGGVTIGRGDDLPRVSAGAPTLLERLAAPLVRVERSLDLAPVGPASSQASRTSPWLRIVLLVLGFGVILFSDQLTKLFRGTTGFLGTYARRVRRALFVGSGCGLIALAFLLG